MGDEEQFVVDAFVEARLLVATTRTIDENGNGHDSPRNEKTPASLEVAVAHEALLRQWRPLKDSIKDSLTQLQVRADLDRQALDWQHGRRDPSYLARGERLAAFEDLAAQHPEDVVLLNREFLDASQASATEQLQTAQRTNRRLRRLVAGLATFLVLTLVATGVAVAQRKTARDQADLALARQLVAQADLVNDSQPDTSLLLRVAALKRTTAQGREEAEVALLDGLNRPFHVSSQLVGHHAAVHRVLFSHDGSTLITAADDGTIRFWDTRRGQQLGVPLSGPATDIWDTALSPDGSLLAVTTGETVRLYDMATRALREPVLTGHRNLVLRAIFSPDGKTLATAGADNDIRLWDAATGRPRTGPLTGHGDVVADIAFSPDGQTLASASWDSTVRLWDVTTAQLQRTLTGHQGPVTFVSFALHGRRLVSASDDATVRLWDVAGGEKTAVLIGHSGSVTAAAVSPDGSTISTGGDDRTVRFWDAVTGKPRGPATPAHTDTVKKLRFTPDGKKVVSASIDGTARLWDVATGEVEATPFAGHSSYINDLAMSPDGRAVATASGDETARIWHLDDTLPPARRDLVGAGAESVKALAFGPQHTLALGTEAGQIQLWDTTTGTLSTVLASLAGGVNSIAINDLGILAAGGDDKTVRLWQLPSGRPMGPSLAANDRVVDVAVSPDGASVAAAVKDGSIRVWDTATGQLRQTLTGHVGSVNTLAFGPNDILVSGGDDKSVRLWSTTAGRAVRDPLLTSGAVLDVTFSPDGRELAATGADTKIHLWDVARWAPLPISFIGIRGWVRQVAFRPNGATLVSAADDGVQAWDAASGQPRGKPLDKGPASGAAFASDASALAYASGSVVHLWNLDERLLVDSACRTASRDLTETERQRFLKAGAGAPGSICT
jgi:WD40 repeat protein